MLVTTGGVPARWLAVCWGLLPGCGETMLLAGGGVCLLICWLVVPPADLAGGTTC
eukprot:COSAG01_NODE_9400_length_2455_cov_8.225382_3_plen_55_part_00